MNAQKILVTGASGHIGNVLVRQLIELQKEVSILTIDGKIPACLNELSLKVHKGDIRDAKAVSEAIKGHDVVFHLAGIISISSYPTDDMKAVNIDGTKNVIEACLEHKINRLVYTSSVHALPDLPNNQVITPESDFNPEGLFGGYAQTKALATKAVKDAVAERGLDAVICFPAGVLGPYDYRGSEAGKMIQDYMYNRLAFCISGRYNFVDVRDVVEGLIAAYDKGRKGEGYMLAGEIFTVYQVIDAIKEKLPATKTPMNIPVPIALGASYITEWLFSFLKKQPPFTPYAIKVLQSNDNFSIEKSQKELGYSPRSIKTSIFDAIEFYQKVNGK